jgi:phosphatidylglycerophosphate synthase
LDRLVVACYRAGAATVTLVSTNAPQGLKRTTALDIPVRVVSAATTPDCATLVGSTGLLIEAAEVRNLIQHGGRLASQDGTLLPIGVIAPGDKPWQRALDEQPARTAEGVACAVSNKADARRAERLLWQSFNCSADGRVDKLFNRPCGRLLSKILIYTPVSPNAVSLFSIAMGLASAWFFAIGSHQAAIIAAVLLQLSAIVDCVDGDIARALFKESPLGKWLDLAGDQVVHVTVFAAIAIGLVRADQTPDELWLGLSAVLGAVLSFGVIVRGMRQPAGERHQWLQKLIDSATNRDFSVLLLVLACFNRLEWFLWMAAIGSHLFWMTALALQVRPPARATAPR